MPAKSPDADHAAFYSATFRPAGETRLGTGTATVGFRDGQLFFHCHAVWTEAGGRETDSYTFWLNVVFEGSGSCCSSPRPAIPCSTWATTNTTLDMALRPAMPGTIIDMGGCHTIAF